MIANALSGRLVHSARHKSTCTISHRVVSSRASPSGRLTCDVVSYIFKRRRHGSNVSRRCTCATSSPRRYVEATLALTWSSTIIVGAVPELSFSPPPKMCASGCSQRGLRYDFTHSLVIFVVPSGARVLLS
ncbi:hypothetical protein BHM03_00025151 [Ensete ventricosum]|nr:hypothetical protein BHM03_00025151 [Ensete ventricosum]